MRDKILIICDSVCYTYCIDMYIINGNNVKFTLLTYTTFVIIIKVSIKTIKQEYYNIPIRLVTNRPLKSLRDFHHHNINTIYIFVHVILFHHNKILSSDHTYKACNSVCIIMPIMFLNLHTKNCCDNFGKIMIHYKSWNKAKFYRIKIYIIIRGILL